ncbi:MAG: SDR family oxidoreductase [Alphaproteobacteria bacterium]|nr:SDR family oxidoreductase [Alphaproteobacteria bacterium]
MASNETALIVGVGPALGSALAREFAGDGMAVALAARQSDTVTALADEIGGKAYACDATDEDQVEALFEAVGKDLGAPDLVVFNAGTFSIMSVLETEADHFEDSWKINCLAGFFVGRAAAAAMKARGSGTIIFTGATASLRGGARFHNLAVGKFGLRALAQSMARELGPENIHVAHVIIDGVIDTERGRAMVKDAGPDGLLDPDAMAGNYLHLHRQARSAWTHELDLRPWAERW